MYKNKFIEITQDAAGVIKNSKENAIGFFTENIQTCLIYVIHTDTVTIAIHDSGQLLIEGMCNFISSYGKVLAVDLVYGSDLNTTNKNRLTDVLSRIGFTEKPNRVDSELPNFSVTYEIGIGLKIYQNTILENVQEIPNKKIVQTIIELNNNFLPINDQSLPLDVQFSDPDFCNNSKLLFSLEEMLAVYHSQKKYRFQNEMFLQKGHQFGLFVLPENL